MSDLWTPDPDPSVERLERELYLLGHRSLTALHLELHSGLGLPALPRDRVLEAYGDPEWDGELRALLSKAGNGNGVGGLLESLRRGAASLLREGRALVRMLVGEYQPPGLAQRAATLTQVGYLVGRAGDLDSDDAAPPPPRSLEAALSIVSPPERFTLEYLSEHALERVGALRDTTRTAISLELLEAAQGHRDAGKLATRLMEQFGTLNRDWRRVAVTELSSARANGFLAGVGPGVRLKWSAASGACEHCAGLDGLEFGTVTGPGDHATELWVGKSNVGRSFSRRRADGRERGPDELSGPCIPLHPHCRCRYTRVAKPAPAGSKTAAYLESLMAL